MLTDLVSQGKIRAFGCSTFPAEDIVTAYYVAERRGYGKFRTEQPPYSLISRGSSTLLPTTQRLGMGVLTWSPLASGFLSGKVRKDQPVDLTTGRAALTPFRFDPSIPGNAAKFDAVEQLIELPRASSCTLPELALAFATTHPAVTSVISGPRTMEQLDGLLKSADLTLDDATWTGSTRSSRRAQISTSRTVPGGRRHSPTRLCAAGQSPSAEPRPAHRRWSVIDRMRPDLRHQGM